MVLGFKKPLEEEDLWDLNDSDKTDKQVEKLKVQWEKQRKVFDEDMKNGKYDKVIKEIEEKKLKIKNAKVAPAGSTEDSTTFENDEKVPLKSENKKTKKGKEDKKPDSDPEDDRPMPSLFKALLNSYWPVVLSASAFKVINDFLQFGSPVILKWMITFLKDDNAPNWQGYSYAILIYITALITTSALHQYFHRVFRVGMLIRSALIGLIYEKSFKLSAKGRGQSSVGELITLMSTDIQRIQDTMSYASQIWSSPLQIIISIYMLYQLLGYSAFAGVGIIILIVPITFVITKIYREIVTVNMKLKSERLKKTGEVLSAIKIFKLYAWELAFAEDITKLRDTELSQMWKAAQVGAASGIFWTCVPLFVACSTFPIYAYTGTDENPHILDSEKVFVSLSLFNIMRFPMIMLPNIIIQLTQSAVSLKRLTKFLSSEEIDVGSVNHDLTNDSNSQNEAIKIEKSTFFWEHESKPILKDINLSIEKGKLIAIIGKVGSGKSSLVQAILGDMGKTGGAEEGTCDVYGKIAYVPQQAWIMNLTLKNNILFNSEENPEKYKRTINNCALKSDFEMLPAGDSTEIGEKGINLSGGQKQRVALARAVYAEADLYLFDDPLSAVDAHVGKHIFDYVMSNEHGCLNGKTRVLVTNAMQYVSACDKIIIIDEGRIVSTGDYETLKNDSFASKYFKEMGVEDQIDEKENEKLEMQRKDSVTTKNSKNDTKTEKQDQEKGKLVEKEKAEEGNVSIEVFKEYFKSMGYLSMILLAFFQLSWFGMDIFSNFWLNFWSGTSDQLQKEAEIDRANDSFTFDETEYRNEYLKTTYYYIIMYSVIGLVIVLLTFLRSITLAWAAIQAGKTMHNNLLQTMIRAPMSFYDTTPFGRILNRFSKDIATLDDSLPRTIGMWLVCFLKVIATFFIIAYASPMIILVIIPLIVFYYFTQRFYVSTSRQLKRLESVTKSPIYNQFGETLAGVSTIRAFSAVPHFLENSRTLVDKNQRCYYFNVVSNRWLATRLEYVANALVVMVCIFATVSKSDSLMSASLWALAINQAISITQTLNWFVRQQSEIETQIVSVERVKEYSENETEKYEADKNQTVAVPESWPETGQLTFDNYSTRYRAGLDLVVKNINVKIQAGERVGIVGRTGAGKSSLTLALFRLIEPAEDDPSFGTILIDDVDVKKLDLTTLRSKLTIIPQDPVLWTGSIKYNVDPLKSSDDDQIWAALEKSNLKEAIQEHPEQKGLETLVQEGGENFSVGQRQLFCLARALIRKSKILVMDEATAAVDPKTDGLIQETIRSEFKGYTVLTIAHRLNTIMDYDKILVLDKGMVSQFDSPEELLKDRSGIFHGLCSDAGLVE